MEVYIERKTMKLQYQLSNGMWADCQDRFDFFINLAVADSARKNTFAPERFPLMGRDEIIAKLDDGKTARTGTDWNDEIRSGVAYDAKMARIAETQKQVEMVKCSCGHTVPKGLVMSASMGSSCSDCYDRMSE